MLDVWGPKGLGISKGPVSSVLPWLLPQFLLWVPGLTSPSDRLWPEVLRWNKHVFPKLLLVTMFCNSNRDPTKAALMSIISTALTLLRPWRNCWHCIPLPKLTSGKVARNESCSVARILLSVDTANTEIILPVSPLFCMLLTHAAFTGGSFCAFPGIKQLRMS